MRVGLIDVDGHAKKKKWGATYEKISLILKNKIIMETRVYTTVETITPHMAQVYLTHNVSNRKAKEKIIEAYSKEMKEGRWMLNGDSIRFAIDGSLIDGQHRLLACIKSEKPFTTLVTRGLESDSMATIDNGAMRTAGDVFFINGIPNANTVTSLIRKAITLRRRHIAAFANGGGARILNSDILDFYNKDADFIKECVKNSNRCYENSRCFKQSMLGAYMYYLVRDLKHKEEEVLDFFFQLADVKPSEYEVIRLCRKTFMNDAMSQVHMVGKVRQILIIKTWNCFIKKNDLKQLRYNNLYDKDLWFI